MFRYFAVVWDRTNEATCEIAQEVQRRIIEKLPDWRTVLSQQGLAVSCKLNQRASGRIYALDQSRGVGFGVLFRRSDEEGAVQVLNEAALGERETRDIIDSSARTFTHLYWGSYVLFFHNVLRDSVGVFRGPASQLACFHVTYQGVQLFFSWVDDCLALRLISFSINWDCIRAQAANGDYLGRGTSVNEIAALECGQYLEIRGNVVNVKSYWHPSTIIKGPTYDFISQAAAEIRSSTRLCVSAWASLHKSILHLLSGGLDSSIVLSCLKRANTNPSVNAVNFYSRQSGDERYYARGMAQRLKVNLIEHERDKAVDLEILLHGPRTPRPILNFSACDNHPAILQIASCTSSTAVFDGEFGDNVFGATSKQEVLYEEVRRHGFGRMFANTAMDYAKLRGLSIWRALRLGFHERWTSHEPYYSIYLWDKRYRDKDSTSLVCHDALVAYEMTMERLIHPWLANIDDLPAGKFLLVFGLLLLTSSDYHSALAAAGGPDVIAPLISQPLVEVALRVPSRFTIHEGQDRAVARLAFQDELTDAVLNRGTGKGTPLLWVRDTIERNRPFLREVLLDGILVKERILDRKKLEALLTGDINKSLVNVSDIFIELYIEAWLRQWTQEGYTPIDRIAPSFLLENHPTIEGR